MTELYIVYGDQRIPYAIRVQPERKARRVAIHVEPDGRVIVDVPPDTIMPQIKAAVAARARWIHTHVSEARTRLAHVLPRDYVSGESLLYLGRRYRLKVSIDDVDVVSVRLKGGYIEVRIAAWNGPAIKAALLDWYLERARVVFHSRMEQMITGLRWVRKVPSIRLKTMKVQWGSCSPSGRMTLNPLLVRAPWECIDYVLLHELCHLREHNHSKRFFRLLNAHMPGWRETKEKLDRLAEVVLNV